nr:gluconate:H+ symporter [Qipengyuania proteolytica]
MILVRKVNAFAALLVAALGTGLAAGLAPSAVIQSITTGMGGVLGFIAVIVGLGALLGGYLEASGGAAALARAIVGGRDAGKTSVAMGVVGIVIAIPVFFDVALILLFPLVASLSRSAGKPALYFGLPLLAGLATAHSFIPPTPGPVAVAEILSAELGLVIVYGLAAGVPAMLVAGPLFTAVLTRSNALPVGQPVLTPAPSGPGVRFDGELGLRALAAIALPIGLIVIAAIAASLGWTGVAADTLAFIGHPFVALLLACGLAALILAPGDAAARERLSDTLARALEPTAVILLVTGAGGAFKQMLVDTGAGAMLAESLLGFGLGPLVGGFLLALVIRIAQGSATVAMLTAAGLTAPLAGAAGLQPFELALMTIAIASGATMASHVNDSGFWLVSRYFGLTSAETLRTWTVSSTLIGLTGFATVLLLALFV